MTGEQDRQRPRAAAQGEDERQECSSLCRPLERCAITSTGECAARLANDEDAEPGPPLDPNWAKDTSDDLYRAEVANEEMNEVRDDG